MKKLVRLTEEQIKTFLKEHRIEYIESGHGVAADHVNIKCPYCNIQNFDGHSMVHHLGIDLKVSRWGCWRDSDHRGMNILRLFAFISGEPLHILEQRYSGASALYVDDLEDKFYRALYKKEETKIRTELQLPSGFAPVSQSMPDRFVNYLGERGFVRDWVDKLSEWGIGYITESQLKDGSIIKDDRVVLPIYIEGNLVGYTGRSINPKSKLRYLSSKGFQPNAAFYDKLLKGGNILLIQEGFFDAIKFNIFAKNVNATAVFTNNLSDKLTALQFQVANLTKRYEHAFVFLDKNSMKQTLNLALKLSLPFKIFEMETCIIMETGKSQVKDTGDLTMKQIRQLEQKLISEN